MMYQDIYNCICQNIKNEDILYIMSNLQPNCCLKIDFQQARLHCDNKPRQIGLDHNYMKLHETFNSTSWMSVFAINTNMVLESRAVSRASPIVLAINCTVLNSILASLRHVTPLNDENCRLIKPVGQGRSARDALPDTFNVGEFESGKN